MTFLTLNHLTFAYGVTPVVDDLSLAVEKGEFMALLGPSGCGKTTILRALAGLVQPSAGRIAVADQDLTRVPVHRRQMGFVFQNYALFPHLNVERNVAFGLEVRSTTRAEIARRVRRALELVRLGGLEARRPRELSGGQQQRVALARALVIEPRVLLLDECLSNLDAKLREELRVEIRDIQKTLGITTVFVTHDQAEALSMCDRVAVLDRGQLVQIGTPREVYDRPVTPFVARFIGRTNELRGTALGGNRVEAGASVLRSAQSHPNGTPVLVMVRPQRVEVTLGHLATPDDPELNSIEGTVRRVTFVGDLVQIAVTTPLGDLFSERGSGAKGWESFREGSPVTLRWPMGDTLVFEDDAA